MNSRSRLVRTVRYGSVVLGLFLLYWGIVSLVSVSYVPSVTVPWLDRALTAISRFAWLSAVGVLLIAVGVSPAVLRVRDSRIVRTLAGVLGIVFLCLGGFFVFVSLNRFWGLVYVFPLFLTSVLLLAVGFDVRRHGIPDSLSS